MCNRTLHETVGDHWGPEAMDAAVEEPQRVKFLCSFGGSILPRPLDGKLRYVGGETRIVSLPRDVTYEDLMARMRELFDGAWALKYQQPEEDLDALVSVVNGDDVVNMMEEYDKLGAGKDGFTRLRIFLFPHPDQDGSGSLSSPRFDADERETERRYVDALNSLPDGKCPLPDVEGGRTHLGSEQFFGSMVGMDVHGHQFSNLHRLKIPRVPSYGQKFSEIDGSWSPAACCSPGHHTPREHREFSPTPPSGRFHVGMEDLSERINDEYVRHMPAQMYEHHQSPSHFDNGNVVWFPPGGVVGEKSGFPGNLGHSHSGYDGSSNICEHCHMAMQRNHAMVADMRYHEHRHPFVEQLGAGIEFGGQFSNSCADCVREREIYLQELKLDQGAYVNEHVEHRSFYSDFHGRDRDWVLHHSQLNHRPSEIRGHRNMQYVVEGSGSNLPYALGNSYNGHLVPPNGISQDNSQYVRPTNELGNEVSHDQHTIGAGPRVHSSPPEDSGLQLGNTSAYAVDGIYQVPHGPSSVHALRRTHGPVFPGPSYEAPGLLLQTNGALNVGYNRVTQEGSPRFPHVGMENQFQNPWMGHVASMPQQMLPVNGTAFPEHHHGNSPKLNPDILSKDYERCVPRDSAVYDHPYRVDYVIPGKAAPSHLANGKDVASASSVNHASAAVKTEENNLIGETSKTEVTLDSNGKRLTEEKPHLVILGEPHMPGPNEKAKEHSEYDKASSDHKKKETSVHCLIPKNDPTKDLEVDSDSEQLDISKIEPTTAEEEALAKGLQTIRNDNLEEVRELGTGTYGAVYHGKWKGSDVAIKRIKASCFSGRPSERERLIADFWKEASILSSLHHPNVVSFFGVVRDGPDGSLATVTEFMVNGSLKQFLQKKDRTIDRRKRLILAMDTAFGMEYLHEKNIVHFDLKCENLLVNMRDPHRPICKIGDLGLSKVKQRTLVSGGVRGTLPWMAPELLSGKTNMVTEKIDVYSFGIVMWELLTAEEPYAGMNCAAIIGGIVNNTLRPQVPSWCDPEWKSLMESCWASDPGERSPFAEISPKLRKMSAAINIK